MYKVLVVPVVLIVMAMVYVLMPEADRLQDGEVSQTGSIEISDRLSYKHEVFYPARFNVMPRVKIKLTKGSANLEIIEQRVDGFIFKASNLGYSVAEGAHVDWVASGLISAQ